MKSWYTYVSTFYKCGQGYVFSVKLKKAFQIDTFIMMGDMFENSVLYSRILNKFQLQKPYFSMNIALDS